MDEIRLRVEARGERLEGDSASGRAGCCGAGAAPESDISIRGAIAAPASLRRSRSHRVFLGEPSVTRVSLLLFLRAWP